MNGNLILHDESDWFHDGETFAQGYAYWNGELFDPKGLAEKVTEAVNSDRLDKLLSELNGFWSIIHRGKEDIVAAVDHIQSHPIYYLTDRPCVGDAAQVMFESASERNFDPICEAEYLLSSYVTSSDTLLPQLQQIEAGESISINVNTKELSKSSYYDYTPSNNGTTINELRDSLEEATERLCTFADGRPIWVSLSAGWDSRLVLCLLKSTGYDNLHTFTFGKPDSREVKIAEEVASSLNIPWHFIEYNEEKWWNWFHSEEMDEYYTRTNNFDCIPSIQGWPAIRELHHSGEVPNNAVFVSGATIASIGEHLPDKKLETRTDLINHIVDTHYCNWEQGPDCSDRLLERLDEQIPNNMSRCLKNIYETWEWKERQSKYMSKEKFVYSYLRYDFWFPLFDKEVLDTWGGLPYKKRKKKSALIKLSREFFASEGDITPSEAKRTEQTILSEIKNRVGRSLVGPVISPIYRWFISRSPPTHHLAYYGFINNNQLDKYYNGKQIHQSYRAMHAVGRMSFNPPEESGVPEDYSIRLSEL